MAKHWSSTDDAYLRANFKTFSHAAIGSALNRPERGVRNRCYRLGLRKQGDGWSIIQDMELCAWYEVHAGIPLNIGALSRGLGKTLSDISERAAHFGLSNRKRPRPDLSAKLKTGQSGWAVGEGSHPRGMLGKTHSAKTRARFSEVQRARVAAGIHIGQWPRDAARRTKQSRAMSEYLRTHTANVYSRCKHGKRADLGNQYFRSSWEANYARFLNLLIQQGQIRSWKYEADTFWFEKIRRGVRSYTPDFKITAHDGAIYYVEVKGWMDAKSKTKLKRMKKYHPTVDLRLVDQKAYKEIDRKLGGAIPNWERAA